jgi:thiol-disulfide isomerase/thioredoxin
MCLFGGCVGARGPSSNLVTHPLYGKPVPSFTRASIDGAKASTEGLVGSIAVVKFFAKYCAPCRETLPHAETVHRAHPNVRFIGIDEDEASADAREMVQTYSLTFPVIHDVDNVLSGRFRVKDLPVTFVVGRNGSVSWVGGPTQNADDLEKAIALAER